MATIRPLPNTLQLPTNSPVDDLSDILSDEPYMPPNYSRPIGPETPDALFKRTGSPTLENFDEPSPRDDDLSDILSDTPPEQEIAPYDWTIGGATLPESMRPVGEYIAGFNSTLAKIAGVAVDDVDLIMRNFGMEGMLDKPGSGKETLIKGMEKLGIAADKKKLIYQYLGTLGEATAENLIMLSTFFAAAPSMLASKGAGTLAEISRQLGTGLIKHPAAAISAEMTAAAGGQMGADLGAQFGPTGETIGGMAGSFVGGVTPMAFSPITSLVSNVRKGAKGITSMLNAAKSGIAAGQPSLIDPAAEPSLISQAIRGDQIRVDNIIERLASKMTQSADPLRSAQQLQKLQRDGYKQARVIEGGYWSKVDQKRKMVTDGLKEWRANLIKATVPEGQSEWLPNDLLEDIKAIPALAPLERLRAIRTKAFMRMQSGTVPTQGGVLPLNDKMRGNLNGLIKAIDGEIDAAFPNDLELKKATSFSRWLHDKFTRGPIAKFARPRAGETTLPPARQAARSAVQHEEFGPQTRDMGDVLEMPAMMQAAEQLMRGQLTEEVTRLGPEAATKFIRQPHIKRFLEAFPKLAAEFEHTGKRMKDFIDFRKEVMNSSFIKLTNEQPQSAIRTLVSSRTRVRDAQALMRRIGKNPDAVAAARNAFIMGLEDTAQGNPTRIIQLLANDDTARAGKIILGDDYDRLHRLARDASSLLNASEGVSKFVLTRGSRVFGAWLGRRLNTGTLQAPEFGGKVMQKITENWLGNIEGDIFSKAIRYPAWEAVLKAKMPETITDLNHLKSLITHAIRVEEAATRSTPLAEETLGIGEDDE